MTATVVGYKGVKPPRNSKGVLFLRNLPAGVKMLFKSVVVRRGDTMERVVAELLRKYIDDPQCVDRWARKRERQNRREKK